MLFPSPLITKAPARAILLHSRNLRFSLPVPPSHTRTFKETILADDPTNSEAALSPTSGPSQAEASAGEAIRTDAEEAVRADQGPLPEKTVETIRRKWEEFEVTPSGPLHRRVIVEEVKQVKPSEQ